MKTKGFTIIEVLVAVIILSVIATALFEISINSKKNLNIYQKKALFENITTLSLFSNQSSNTNLYEQIRTKYKIKDDEFRRKLKSIKLTKKTTTISTKKYEDLTIKIDQIQIYSKENSTIYYKIGLK